MSLRNEQCNKVCWILDDVLANRPTERDSLIVAVRKAFEGRKKGKWIIKDNPGTGWYRVTCSECGEDVTSVIPMIGFFPNAKALWNFCPDCGARMEESEESDG